MVQMLNIDKQKYTKRFFSRLDQRRSNGNYDFTILVGAQMIRVEQNVLACGSDYFDAMFSHDTEEKQTDKVQMHDVDFESVKTCIDFIYGNDVNVLPEKYEDLMLAADMMQLTELCDAIEENMENNLNVQTFFNLRKTADKFGCKNLQEKCQTFAENHFDVISQRDEFMKVELSFLMDLLRMQHSQVADEGKVQIILKWVRHSTEHRKKSLTELVQCVDLSKLSPTRGRWYMKNEPLINTNSECLLHFSLAVIDSIKTPPDGARAITPGGSQSSGLEILLIHRDRAQVQIFNTESGIRNYDCRRPQACENYTLAELNKCVYALGKDKSVQCLSYANDVRWERKRDMLLEHGRYPPAVSHSGSIYVLGGHGGLATNSAVEQYDPLQNTWRQLEDAPLQLVYSCVISSGGFIYNLGGWGKDGWLKDVYRINSATMQWETMAPMRESKAGVAAAECDGIIFVSGGHHKVGGTHDKLNSFEQFDPSKNQWTLLPRMTLGRNGHRLYVNQGFLYAVGGFIRPKHGIEKYDIEKKKWTVVEHSMMNLMDSVALGEKLCIP